MQHDKKSRGQHHYRHQVHPAWAAGAPIRLPMTELPALLGIKENED